MLPRRSNSVCNLMAALVERNGAQANTDRHRSMVLASKSVDRVFQVDAKRVLGIKTTGDGDERLGKVGVDAPVATLVGIGQSAARHPALDAHVVQLVRLRAQTRFDVAQTFSIGQLSKGQAQILVEAGKTLDLVLSAIARHATVGPIRPSRG